MREKRFSAILLLLLVAVLPILAGCSSNSIVGEWEFDSYESEIKNGGVSGVMTLMSYVYNDDGTFYWGKSEDAAEIKGTYTYEDGELVLSDENGEEAYECEIDGDTMYLHISDEVTFIFTRK